MKYLLYEVTEDFDVIIKFTFYKHNMLHDFIKMHTEEKKYEPRFLVLELNDDDDIDFISHYHGTKEISKKYVVDYVDKW